MLTSYLTFFKAHERAILVLAALVVIGFGVNKYLDKSYDAAVARQQAAQQVLEQQVSKNNELQKNVDSLQQRYGQLLDTLTKQNQSLVASIAARNQAVVKQQSQDSDLSLAELANRQKTLAQTDGVNSTENGLTETPLAAIAITQALETLPVLRQDNQDLQTLANNKDSQITGLNGVITGLGGQVDGLKLQLTDFGKTCDARVSVAKKSRWKWFKAGTIAGFAAGVLTGHYL